MLRKIALALLVAALGAATSALAAADDPAGLRLVTGTDATTTDAPAPGPPTATTHAAIDVTQTGATLHGAFNPHGNQVAKSYFEWGTDTSYGRLADAGGFVDGDFLDHDAEAALSGLEPGKTYHYRLVVLSRSPVGPDVRAGTRGAIFGVVTRGEDQFFTTGATTTTPTTTTETTPTTTTPTTTQTATAPPAQTVQGAATPPAAAPLPAITKVVAFPSAKACASRRNFRIRIRKVPGLTIASAEVRVNGKRVSVLKGKRLTAGVDLRALPRGTFKVKITVTTSDGRTITGSRSYRTCVKKRQSRAHGPL